jgi:hypothetical protein
MPTAQISSAAIVLYSAYLEQADMLKRSLEAGTALAV